MKKNEGKSTKRPTLSWKKAFRSFVACVRRRRTFIAAVTLLSIFFAVFVSPYPTEFSRDLLMIDTTTFSVVLAVYAFIYENLSSDVTHINSMINQLKNTFDAELKKYLTSASDEYHLKYATGLALILYSSLELVASALLSLYAILVTSSRLLEAMALGLAVSPLLLLTSMLVLHHGYPSKADIFKSLKLSIEKLEAKPRSSAESEQSLGYTMGHGNEVHV